jgi:hypothetical protein
MDPISNADRLVLLLRQKLEERTKSSASRGTANKPAAGAPPRPSGVRALAAIDWSDARPLRRAIVENLLADQLGPDLINDAQFQQIVSRVTAALEEDEKMADLLTRVASELRHS